MYTRDGGTSIFNKRETAAETENTASVLNSGASPYGLQKGKPKKKNPTNTTGNCGLLQVNPVFPSLHGGGEKIPAWPES